MSRPLLEFYQERLNETEQVARRVDGDGRWDITSTGVLQLGGVAGMDGLVSADADVVYHAARHDPAGVLADVAAKRRVSADYEDALRIQAGYSETGWETGRREALERALLALAQPHSGHCTWRREWTL